MIRKKYLPVCSTILLIMLLGIVGCSSNNVLPNQTDLSMGGQEEGSNQQGFFSKFINRPRSTQTEPFTIYPLVSEPLQDPESPVQQSLTDLQGTYVAFYTWQSTGCFVTKEEVENYVGIDAPWDLQVYNLSDFVQTYNANPGIPSEPYEGLVLFDPYELDNSELNVDPVDLASVLPGMSKAEAFNAIKESNRNIERPVTSVPKNSDNVIRTCSGRINTYDPPTYNIGMDICDWVVESCDDAVW